MSEPSQRNADKQPFGETPMKPVHPSETLMKRIRTILMNLDEVFEDEIIRGMDRMMSSLLHNNEKFYDFPDNFDNWAYSLEPFKKLDFTFKCAVSECLNVTDRIMGSEEQQKYYLEKYGIKGIPLCDGCINKLYVCEECGTILSPNFMTSGYCCLDEDEEDRWG